MLYLNADNFLEAVNYDQVMDAIEEAYAIEIAGNFEMPSRIHINQGENTILYMPCFLEGIFGTKVLSLFPANASRNLPVISGLVILNEASTGRPAAILDGAGLTALRTGAVSGVAIRHTAPEYTESLGLIGAGVQGYQQVLFACKARNIKRVYIFDLLAEKVNSLSEQLRLVLPHVRFAQCGSVEELLADAKIVITATPSEQPVLPDDVELLRDKCYIGIGSYKPEMREFPKALYGLVDQVLIDTSHSLEESGDLITPLKNGWITDNQIVRFSLYLEGGNKRSPGKKTTLFKAVGMALFDLVVAELIYRKALEKNIGTVLS